MYNVYTHAIYDSSEKLYTLDVLGCFYFAWANVRAFNSYANEKVIDPNWEAYACVLLEGKLNIETNEQSVSEK